ncbi:hypothetical protein I7X12_06220 [Halosimplex litoreum]|uniref:Uncharacterized protein n=1 Tax=Halosimplex litoreum TaxID=1198301 RepID=A0A7T3G0S6_9EURY|nr:hypothetical protein [Halosimplex litoreum]QPV64216.1 hypothetical protein I7X12_06220 [Halosimplex litoreum]
MTSRRSVLAAASLGLAVTAGGCLTSSDADDGPTETRERPRSDTATAADPVAAPTDDTDTATGSRAPTSDDVAALAEECVTDEFAGYTGTTPQPTPERPADPTPESAVAYARAYERYYLAYQALYDIGPRTPDGLTGVPAHDFPEVTLAEATAEPLDGGDGWAVVRLAYDRVFEEGSRGPYTVTYYVSTEATVRAETAGRVSPGPDPVADGRIQQC